MSNCNIFALFGRGFLAGAGYGLGVGLCNIARSAMWNMNMQFPPLFGSFSFMPFNCCFGNNFYAYNTPMPNITLPLMNTSVFSTNNSFIDSSPTIQVAPMPQFNIPVSQELNMDTVTFGSTVTPTVTSTVVTPVKRQASSRRSISNGSHIYASLSKSEAEARAKKDSNLEELTGGEGWIVSDASFENDIKFAKKGTGALLTRAAKEAGVSLTVTSALGTKFSPHDKKISGTASHYNENNPKLDLGGGLSHAQAEELKNKLIATGLFSRVAVESDGNTSHLDVQFADSAYETV